jgi:enamine deaminase RidA (YjgF/YER057c/UK114 family)
MQHHIRPAGLPPVNGYSHAVAAVGTLVAVSGQVPLDRTGALVGGPGQDGAPADPEAQLRQVFTNLGAALGTAGAGWDDVLKLTVFLTDLGDLAIFRTVRDEFVDTTRPPACSLVRVAGLVHPEFRVEIDALAVVSG